MSKRKPIYNIVKGKAKKVSDSVEKARVLYIIEYIKNRKSGHMIEKMRFSYILGLFGIQRDRISYFDVYFIQLLQDIADSDALNYHSEKYFEII